MLNFDVNFFKKNQLVIWLGVIFFSVLYAPKNLGLFGLYLPFNVMVWFSVSLFILYTSGRAVYLKRVYYNFWTVMFTAFLFILFILGLKNTNAGSFELIQVALAFLVIAMFVFSLFQYEINEKKIKHVLFMLLILGFFQALISIIQIHDERFIFFSSTMYAPLLSSLHLASGSMQQVNMLASFMAFILALTLYIIISMKGLQKSLLGFCLVMAFVSVYIITISGSRSAAVISLVSILLLITMFIFSSKKSVFSFFMWVVLVSLGVVFAVTSSPEGQGVQSVTAKMGHIASGVDIRIDLYRIAWKQISISPVFGHGIDGYVRSLVEVGSSGNLPLGFDEKKLEGLTHPHNELVYWTIQSGVMVLIGFIGLSAILLIRLYSIHGIGALGYLALIAPFFLQAMFSYSFSLSAIHLFLFFLFVFLGIRDEKLLGYFNLERASISVYGIIFISTLMLFYGTWHTLKSAEEIVEFKSQSAYELFNQKGLQDDKLYFEHAMYNPLYKEGVGVEMVALLHNGLQKNKPKDVIQFVFWVNKMGLEKQPVEILIALVEAYVFLKQPNLAQEAYELLENKFANSPDFQSFRNRLSQYKTNN